MRPRPRNVHFPAPRRTPAPRPATWLALRAGVALAVIGALGACDGEPSTAAPKQAPRLELSTTTAGVSMTITEYLAAQAAGDATVDSSTSSGPRLSVGVSASLAPTDASMSVSAAEETAAYTTYTDAASLAAAGTLAFTTNFDAASQGPVDAAYTVGGVTFRSQQNVILVPPTFLLRSKAIFNNFWTPLEGTLDADARYTMFGANVTVASRDGSSSPVSAQITTNVATYTFTDLVIPHASTGFAFFGITLTTPGEFITGFRFSSRGEGWAVGLDDVSVGHAIRPNQAPIASAGGPYQALEGQAVALSAAASTDPDGDAVTFAWDLDGDGDYDDATGASASRAFDDEGAFNVGVQATDANGATAVATATVTVANVAPTATPHAPATVPEGSAIAFGLTNAVDVPADVPGLRYGFDCSGATPPAYGVFGTTASTSCATTDDGTRVVRGKVVDEDGGATEYSAAVLVTNVAPTVGTPSVPIDPVRATSPVTVSATFSDPGSGDTFTGEVRWDESGSFEPATISGTTVSASRLLPPGVYTVTLRVRDDDGGEGQRSATTYVVVYDPSAGFVTGGGWISYGGSACATLCGGAPGRADFGFVAKDQKGTDTPSGSARFEFHARAFTFVGESYDWLVVAGSRAQFKGVGTINGRGSYGFLITAVDGEPDRFRIKIWDRASGSENDPVFDNGAESALDKVGGNGSIVIHSN